jgi:DNA-binding MarR family transcriptional regulator
MAERELGPLLETYVNRVWHTKDRTIDFMSKASVPVSQVILLNAALMKPDSSPSDLASAMRISLSSIRQMIERLAKLRFLDRSEDTGDRRRNTINVSLKAKALLAELKVFARTNLPSQRQDCLTQRAQLLTRAITQALLEFDWI